jgi:hypothetical protein
MIIYQISFMEEKVWVIIKTVHNHIDKKEYGITILLLQRKTHRKFNLEFCHHVFCFVYKWAVRLFEQIYICGISNIIISILCALKRLDESQTA